MKRFGALVIAVGLMLAAAGSIRAQTPAGYQDYVIAESAGALSQTQVSLCHNGRVVVAWQDDLGQIWTRAVENHVPAAPVLHGPGKNPALSFTTEECYLAYASGRSVIAVEGDGTTWGTPTVFTTGNGLQTANPDFSTYNYGVAGSKHLTDEMPALYLVWEEGARIYLAAKPYASAWGEPALVASDGVGYSSSWPEVEWTLAGSQTYLPRVYYRQDALPSLGYRQYDGQSWSDWTSPPSFAVFGAEYDVAVLPNSLHAVLSLGVPRTCPCNDIGYTEESATGSWSPRQDLTVYQDYDNLPAGPSLSCSAGGEIHAFWNERFFNQSMEPTGETVINKDNYNGIWFSSSLGFFNHQEGQWTDVCGDPLGSMPSYVWVESTETGGSRIVLRHPLSDGGGGVAVTPPDAAAGFTAAPSPFSAHTALAFMARSGASLSGIELLDLQGRLVRSLAPRQTQVGENLKRFEADWDGRAGSGALAPAGIYFVRARGLSTQRGMVVKLK